jgi:hypothetical protein
VASVLTTSRAAEHPDLHYLPCMKAEAQRPWDEFKVTQLGGERLIHTHSRKGKKTLVGEGWIGNPGGKRIIPLSPQNPSPS